ncbi:hypothetical protein HQ560_18325, partial [bacterium]|nr:hypothetical protein [bacterium]
MAEAEGRQRRVLSLRGKFALAVAAPVMFLLLLELGLFLGGYEGRPDWALYNRVPRHKPTGTVRIAVVGGSAAAGSPMSYAAGAPEFLRPLLHDIAPDQPVEVFNCAVNALGSDGVLFVAEKILPRDIDILIVYSGHNEFFTDAPLNLAVARWSPDPQTWVDGARTRRLLSDVMVLLRGGEEPDTPPTRTERELTRRAGSPKDYEPGCLAPVYEARLRRLVAMADEAGTRVVLCTLACELRNVPPVLPRHREKLTDERRAAWETTYGAGRKCLEAGDAEGALAAFAQAAAIDNGHADLLYAAGHAHLAAGQAEKALPLLAAARDRDFMSMRQTSFRNDAVRRVAALPGVVLADVEKTFQELSRDGIPCEDVFLDHVHLNLEGYLHLARAWAHAIEKAALLGDKARWDWTKARSLEAYRAAFSITPVQHAEAYAILALQMAAKEIGGRNVPALCRPEALAYIRRRGPELFAMSIRTAPHALDWRLDGVNPVYWTYIARGHALAGDHARAATIYKRA